MQEPTEERGEGGPIVGHSGGDNQGGQHPRDHGSRGDDDSGTQYRWRVYGGRQGRVHGRDQEGLWRNKAKIEGRGIESDHTAPWMCALWPVPEPQVRLSGKRVGRASNHSLQEISPSRSISEMRRLF
jgi:hypothetical protein